MQKEIRKIFRLSERHRSENTDKLVQTVLDLIKNITPWNAEEVAEKIKEFADLGLLPKQREFKNQILEALEVPMREGYFEAVALIVKICKLPVRVLNKQKLFEAARHGYTNRTDLRVREDITQSLGLKVEKDKKWLNQTVAPVIGSRFMEAVKELNSGEVDTFSYIAENFYKIFQYWKDVLPKELIGRSGLENGQVKQLLSEVLTRHLKTGNSNSLKIIKNLAEVFQMNSGDFKKPEYSDLRAEGFLALKLQSLDYPRYEKEVEEFAKLTGTSADDAKAALARPDIIKRFIRRSGEDIRLLANELAAEKELDVGCKVLMTELVSTKDFKQADLRMIDMLLEFEPMLYEICSRPLSEGFPKGMTFADMWTVLPHVQRPHNDELRYDMVNYLANTGKVLDVQDVYTLNNQFETKEAFAHSCRHLGKLEDKELKNEVLQMVAEINVLQVDDYEIKKSKKIQEIMRLIALELFVQLKTPGESEGILEWIRTVRLKAINDLRMDKMIKEMLNFYIGRNTDGMRDDYKEILWLRYQGYETNVNPYQLFDYRVNYQRWKNLKTS